MKDNIQWIEFLLYVNNPLYNFIFSVSKCIKKGQRLIFLSLILLDCTFLGNFRVNGLFLLFLPKALFGFLEQINFIKIYCIVTYQG